jgi:hypothetical protein
MIAMAEICYCIDSSSLIDLGRKNPIDVYPGVWEKLSGLIEEGRLISCTEVYKELIRGDDNVGRWTKKHRHMFRRLDASQVRIVHEIVAKHPAVVDHTKEHADADVFLVTLALAGNRTRAETMWPMEHVVVTEERMKKPKVNVPSVCASYNVDFCNVLEMFRREKWTF